MNRGKSTHSGRGHNDLLKQERGNPKHRSAKGKEDKKGRKKVNERLQANVTKLTGKGEWMIPMAGMIGQCFGV